MIMAIENHLSFKPQRSCFQGWFGWYTKVYSRLLWSRSLNSGFYLFGAICLALKGRSSLGVFFVLERKKKNLRSCLEFFQGFT